MISAGLRAAKEFGSLVYPGAFDGSAGDEERVRLTKEYLLYMVDEIGEVLRETNWKAHRMPSKPLVRGNILEELIDMLKFWLGVASLWGFTEADIAREFHRKTEVVMQRYKQECALAETRQSIVIVDIDGVLADYPESFHRFVEKETRGDYSGVDGREMARLKGAYRDLGFEGAFVSVRPGARTFLDAVGAMGYFRLALTSRPYDRYKRLFGDTLGWFESHGITVEAVVFEEDKAAFVLRLLDEGKDVALFVDDDERYAAKVEALGVRTRVMRGGEWPYDALKEGEASDA